LGRETELRPRRRVDLERAARVDREHERVRDRTDVQLQREAVRHDGRAAVGVEDQAAEVERDAEEQLEAGGGDGDVDEAAALREADERDLALDAEAEAGIDARRAERLDAAGCVQRDKATDRELEADRRAEVRL